MTNLETLENRWLLSMAELAAGAAMLFDFDGNGSMDGVLINSGRSAIQYDYVEGSDVLAAVNITADGGRFATNMHVDLVGDNSVSEDFLLGNSAVGSSVRYRNRTYWAMDGATSVQAGSMGSFEVGLGDLASATATEGDIQTLRVRGGDLGNVWAAGDVGQILVDGDAVGSIHAGGVIGKLAVDNIFGGAGLKIDAAGIGTLAANAIAAMAALEFGTIDKLVAGTISGRSSITTVGDLGVLDCDGVRDADITVGGNVHKLKVRTISGSPEGTTITFAGRLERLDAQTITGGLNGTLDLSFAQGVDELNIGLLEGGTASEGGYAAVNLSVLGTVGKLTAGRISGGQASGAGSYVQANISIDDLFSDDWMELLSPGDLQVMRVTAMTGGVGSDGGEAVLFFNVSNDLVDARVGQMVGSGTVQPISDPSIYFTVGHDIVKLVAGQITAGTATADAGYGFAAVFILASHDIQKLVAGTIDAGNADGEYTTVGVWINAGHDIDVITANVFSGGTSSGEGAMAGVWVEAGRNINFVGASLISGTQSNRPIADPTVKFIAGGDIGTVMAGRITGGNVMGDGAQASVEIRAEGWWADAESDPQGDIGAIYAGTITGGSATGANALSFVSIYAAHDIVDVCADRISGGSSADGGYAYTSIQAAHDIVSLQAGTIIGSENGGGGADPAVQIQAFNDIKSLVARQIVAGENGTVNIIAGYDAQGNASGELDAEGNVVYGSIESMVVGTISGQGGVVNILAGGDVEELKACRVVSGQDGTVNITAGGDITADIKTVREWTLDGVNFNAGGEIDDVRNSIAATMENDGAGEVATGAEPDSVYVYDNGVIDFPTADY